MVQKGILELSSGGKYEQIERESRSLTRKARGGGISEKALFW